MIERTENIVTTDDKSFALGGLLSKGAQPKWFHPETKRYIKEDYYGYESLAEWLVSLVLSTCTNLDKDWIVPYHLCLVNGKEGCYSYDFKGEGEDEVTLLYLLENSELKLDRNLSQLTGKPLTQSLDIVCSALELMLGKRFDADLKLLFAIDAFFLNEDRHYNNVSILRDKNGNCRLAPCFDNGMSLMSRVTQYTFSQNIRSQLKYAKPVIFTSDFSKHLKLYDGKPFIYRSKVESLIQSLREIDSREVDRAATILNIQLRNKYTQKLFIPEEPGLTKSSIFS